MYCDKFNPDQKLFGDTNLPSNDINTLVLDQTNLGIGINNFPPEFMANLNIGNLIIHGGRKTVIDSIQFNKKSLKVLTLKNVDMIGVQWSAFGDDKTKSSVKSIHIEDGKLNTIEKTFSDVFPQLEFATFTNCQLQTIQAEPTKGKVNAFETLKKLKFLTLSHNNLNNIDWLYQSSIVYVGSYDSLVRLDLSSNKINSILLGTFNKGLFPQLKYLDMKDNPFTTVEYIEPSMFNQLTELWVDIKNKDQLEKEIKRDNPKATVQIYYHN